MAFNPFDIFRRNQRILFSLITVVVMFTFVLQFGQGDIFSSIPRWLASRARTGEVLAVVGGSKVYSSEIGEIETKRLLANEYMTLAAIKAFDNLNKKVMENLPKATALNKQTLERAQQAMQSDFQSQQFRQRIQFSQQLGMPMPTLDEQQTDREATFGMTQADLAGIINAKAPNENDREAAQALSRLIDLQDHLMQSGFPNRRHYFSNQPSRTTKDNLEFMLWLKKADQLGIHYTDDDIKDLTEKEFGNVLSQAEWNTIAADMKSKRAYLPKVALAGRGDEFRVRAAQEAILGTTVRNNYASQYDAPTDFYDFYRKETNPAQYKLIAVPAENFVDKVQGTPDDAARREIFQAGKNDDPNPRLPRFGLREPRKLKVAYFDLPKEEEYFKKAAAEAMQKLDTTIAIGSFLFAPLPGVNLSAVLAAPAGLVPNLRAQSQYIQYKTEHAAGLKQTWFSIFPTGRLPDPAFQTKPSGVSLTAALAGLLSTGGNTLAATTLVSGHAILADQRTRTETLPSALIVPVMPGLGGLATAIGNLASVPAASVPLPLANVKNRLATQFEERLVAFIVQSDIIKLFTDIRKLEGSTKEAEAKKLIEAFTTARGIKPGVSKDLHDQYSIATDEGLKPLREKKIQEGRFAPPRLLSANEFGTRLFFDIDPNTQRRMPNSGLFKPDLYPDPSLPTHLIYRVEETTPEPLRDINSLTAKAKVEAAWKRSKARELAKKAAEDLAGTTKALGTNYLEIDPKLTQIAKNFAAQFPAGAAQDRVKFFPLEDVAPVVETAGVGAFAQKSVGRYEMRESENIPYPTRELVTELVNNKDKPLSTTLVLSDAAGDTFYVAVLVSRLDRTVDEFHVNINGSMARSSPLYGIISRNHREELRVKNRELAVSLLKSEFGYDKESESVNKKSSNDE
jgi:hypothetical protein